MSKDLIPIEVQCQKIQDEIQDVLNLADSVGAALKRFPLLQKDVDRHKIIRYHTPEVNFFTTHAEIRHKCSCCKNAPVLLSPYIELYGLYIYGDPVTITIGQRLELGGDLSLENFQGILRAANLPTKIVELAEQWFKKNPPVIDFALTEEDLLIEDPLDPACDTDD